MDCEMKILLISISRIAKYSNSGLDLIAGFLRNEGYHVDIKYFHLCETYSEMIERIPLNYDVYGMSIYSSNYQTFRQLSAHLKNRTSGITVWGGAFPSMYYRDIFEENQNIDYIILGDGEQPFLYLLSTIRNSEKVNHESIATRSDIENKHNACNREITYQGAYDYYYNVLPEQNREKIHCIQSKNNICTGNCSFCYERKGPIVYKSIDLIIDEIKYVSENFNVKKFFFSDDNLLDPNNQVAKERMIELCGKILQLNKRLIFTCYIKAISFNNSAFDSEVLSLMRRAGFVTAFIGIESGNNDDLILYNKKTTVEDNLNIIYLLKQNDIIPMVGFINFNPYSTLEKLRKNYEFLVEIGSNNLFSYACAFLNLYKGTSMYKKAETDKLIKPAYTILNDLEYEFYYSEVRPVIAFLRDKLTPRIKSLKVETSWLIQRCEDCIFINPEAVKFRDYLQQRQMEEFEVMKEYFHYLYEDNDVKKCEYKLDEFMLYFESAVPKLNKILKEIKEIYRES